MESFSASLLSSSDTKTADSVDSHLKSQWIDYAKKQLEAQRKSFLNADAESLECQEFVVWATKAKNVKMNVSEVPEACWSLPKSKVELLDFSPKGGRKREPDDAIYKKDRNVWERVPRGCTILKVTSESKEERFAWAVRSNRKFTGYEDDDEAASDARLYSIPSAPPSAFAIFCLKENGSVVHISARHFTLGAQKFTLLFIGSKKIHVCFEWNADTAKMLGRLQSYKERHPMVYDMSAMCFKFLTDEQVQYLAAHRLVLNAERLEPVGSGPVDNRNLHDLSADTPFCFSFTFNSLKTMAGLELCMNPVFSLDLLQQWKWPTVRYFVGSLDRLDVMKAVVASLPDVEGCVVYYASKDGDISQLEKVKSQGYVVIRALREKMKTYLRKLKKGLGDLPSESAQAKFRREMLAEAQVAIAKRISNIDHIPMTDEERARWQLDGKCFAQWTFSKVEGGMDTNEFLDAYSSQWSRFLVEVPKRTAVAVDGADEPQEEDVEAKELPSTESQTADAAAGKKKKKKNRKGRK